MDNGLVLIVFVCLFVCLLLWSKMKKLAWPTHPAISVDLSLKSETHPICCCPFFCLFVFFLVKIIIVIIAVGIGG